MPPRLLDFQQFVLQMIDTIFAFGGVIFLAYAVYIGFQWLTSGGNDEKLQELRQRINYLVIGFLLYFLSVAIVSFIYQLFEVRYCGEGDIIRPGFNIFFSEPCE